ncbi:TrkH family potassium uptake protein [Opitutae bacterium]|nr:TrkH family potassium uptake protein [Opitutae bacterium]
MNLIIIQKLLSIVYFAMSLALGLCMLGGLVMGETFENKSIEGFLYGILITLTLAIFLKIISNRSSAKPETDNLFFRREALCTIGLTWLSSSLIGALPFYLGLENCSFVDALFEGTSGLTTTGATIFSEFSDLTHSLFLWRSLSQWIGGLGVIVFFVAILTSIGAGAKILFSSESSVTASDFEQGRIQDGVNKLLVFYISLTVICFIAYKLGGMNWFDALNHAMTTIATGGFSTHTQSFAFFNSPLIEAIAIVFMLISATSFIFIIRLVEGSKDIFKKGIEVYVFYGLTFLSMILISLLQMQSETSSFTLQTFREVLFQTSSIITTTGYTSTNYDLWIPSAKVVLIFLMFIGGCSGSTSGGIKLIRVIIVFKTIFRTLEQTYRPNKTIIPRLGKKALSDTFIHNVLIYVILIFTIQGISVIVLALLEPNLNLISLFSAVQSALYNIGPGFDSIGPSENFSLLRDTSKVFLAFLMILGRLEIYALIVLFIPKIWRSYS